MSRDFISALKLYFFFVLSTNLNDKLYISQYVSLTINKNHLQLNSDIIPCIKFNVKMKIVNNLIEN